LALLNTMGVCYKGWSFSTTANFAWWLLESEPLQPFNKGTTSSAGMRKAAAGCQKIELWFWLQKSFCWWCSNFYTYIPWSIRRMCPIHIVQHALFQSYKEISALYVSFPLWIPMFLGAKCASLFQEISLPMHISISILHSLPLRATLRDMAGQSLTSLGQTWGSS